MILILQVDPKSFPAFLNDYPNRKYIFQYYVPLFYCYRPDPKAPEDQKQHIALTGQAANMMNGWPQAKIFRTDGSLAAEFSDPDLFVERKFMSILSDAAAGKTPRLLMPKKIFGIKRIN